VVSISESYRRDSPHLSGWRWLGCVDQDHTVDDAVELSSLLASLEEITGRVSALVERNTGIEGIDAELVALERSLSGAVRRLRRASRSADKRR
jgi:hypothetical protein